MFISSQDIIPYMNSIGSAMVSVLNLSAVEHGFEPKTIELVFADSPQY